MKTISIVIVNWNSGTQLQECIESIESFGQNKSSLLKVVVVDNNSTDGSIDCFSSDLPLVILRNKENIGFGAACNQGVDKCEGDYILFLNPDARLFTDSLEKSLEFMERGENAKIGICGIQLIDEFGHVSRSCTRFPSATGFVLSALGVDRLMPRVGHFMSEWDHASTRQVDHVIGAFFLIRRHIFDSVHGFDEKFFVYLEDLDLSYRVKQLGWATVYLSDAQAFHAGGGTSRQIKAKRLFYSLRSRILYSFKHFNPLTALLVLLVTLFFEPFSRSALAAMRFSWASLKETWAAYGMLFRWLPEWVFKGVTR